MLSYIVILLTFMAYAQAKLKNVTDTINIGEAKLNVQYDTDIDGLYFELQDLPKDQWIGLAFGTGMNPGDDFIGFFGSGNKGGVVDLVEPPGYGFIEPIADDS